MKEKHSPLFSTYGPIEGICLLGGGTLLRSICSWALSEGAPLKVITSPRHAEERVRNETLIDFLSRNRIEHTVASEISETSVSNIINGTDNYFFLSLGAAWIFKEDVLNDLFSNKLFNLHGTRLPQNRGGGASVGKF